MQYLGGRASILRGGTATPVSSMSVCPSSYLWSHLAAYFAATHLDLNRTVRLVVRAVPGNWQRTAAYPDAQRLRRGLRRVAATLLVWHYHRDIW